MMVVFGSFITYHVYENGEQKLGFLFKCLIIVTHTTCNLIGNL